MLKDFTAEKIFDEDPAVIFPSLCMKPLPCPSQCRFTLVLILKDFTGEKIFDEEPAAISLFTMVAFCFTFLSHSFGLLPYPSGFIFTSVAIFLLFLTVLKDFTAEIFEIFDEEPAAISQFLATDHLSTGEKGQFTFPFPRLQKIEPIETYLGF